MRLPIVKRFDLTRCYNSQALSSSQLDARYFESRQSGGRIVCHAVACS